MAKIMVTGATGLLGRTVVAGLQADGHDVVACGFSRAAEGIYHLDLTNANAVDAFISQQQVDTIVHCAAERRPDVSEQAPHAALALNFTASQAIAQSAKNHGAWLIYISTDYVFDGSSPGYREDAKPNPVNFYGESKWRGEQAVQAIDDDFAILRLPILYGKVSDLTESAVTVLLQYLLNTQAQDVDHWAMRRPTSTVDVAAAIGQMIAVKLAGKPISGIYHFSGQETFTKYEMLLVLGELLLLDTSHLSPQTTPTDSAKRPRDCTLACERLAAHGIHSTVNFRRGMLSALTASSDALAKVSPELAARLP